MCIIIWKFPFFLEKEEEHDMVKGLVVHFLLCWNIKQILEFATRLG